MSGFARFTVTVEELTGGWAVRVDESNNGTPHGSYATVQAPTLDVALRMAIPYMADATAPDPFAGLGGDPCGRS